MPAQPLTVEEICNKLRPVFGKRIDEIYLKYAMADSKEEKEEIEHLLNVLYRKHLSELLDKKVLLEPPKKEMMNGTYNLSLVSYAGKKLFPFNLREQDWMRHVCISGMSGSGKTTLAFHIINNFIQKKKPFLIFDWKKSFRPLLLIDNEIMLFTLGNENISNYFKININEPPPGIAPKEWINVLCDLITESFFVSYGVHKILLETLDEAFRDFGVYNGSRNYPTWNEIKWRLEDKMEKKKGREASWLMSALRVAHVMTFGNFGKAMNYKGKEIFSVEDLLNKKIIFELNALGTVEKKFLCEFILTYIYKLKKARQRGINNSFDHAILVDEAHNIFLKEKTHFVTESVTDMIYREMREYGTSLICLDQHISKISDTVSGNSACLIAFQQQLPQDIDTISGLMQLRENKNYFSMLPVGSAIVKLSERYASPFLVEVPNVPLREKEVSDYDVKTKMKFIFDSKNLEQGADKEFMQKLAPEVQKTEYKKPEEIEENKTVQDLAFNRFGIAYVRKQPEVKEDKQLSELSEKQKILYEFVEKKLNKGEDIKKIERTLELHTIEGNYSISDVFNVITYALKQRLKMPKQQEPKPVAFKPASTPKPTSSYTLPAFTFVTQPVKLTEPVSEPKQEALKTKHVAVQTPKYVTTSKIQNNKVYKAENPVEKEETREDNNSEEKLLEFLRENPSHTYTTTEIYNMFGFSARKGNQVKKELLKLGKIKIEEAKNAKGWKKLMRLK